MKKWKHHGYINGHTNLGTKMEMKINTKKKEKGTHTGLRQWKKWKTERYFWRELKQDFPREKDPDGKMKKEEKLVVERKTRWLKG